MSKQMQKQMMRNVENALNGYGVNNKKGQLGTLQGIVLSLVVIGVLIGAAFLIMGSFLTEVTTQGNAQAITGVNQTIVALQKVPSFLGLIVLIAIIAVIVALIFGAFPGARSST